jgi:signal transduction histidine kinase
MPASFFERFFSAYCEQQGRALRVFDRELNVLWDNADDLARGYPLFQDPAGRVAPIPAAGPHRRAWPVARVFESGERIERMYSTAAPNENEKRCFRVRAWVLADDPERGRLVIEETEATDERYCQESRLEKLDEELNTLILQVTDFLTRNTAPYNLHLRLANPHLQCCKELVECVNPSCNGFNHDEHQRCWEPGNTHCRDGLEIEDPLRKLQYCDNCEVFLLACPDPLTRVGENFNRLLSLLQMKQREALEAQQQVQQAEKLATIGELMTGLAHEIKTPLSVIVGRLECLALELDVLSAEDLSEDLSVMRGHAERMCGVLDDLLTLARPKPPRKSRVRINDVIERVSGMMRKTLEKSRIEVESKLAGRLPEIHADAAQLQQVLINLMLNARDAMAGGGRIRLRSWRPRGGGGIAVSVGDNGDGIEPDKLQRIFSPFFSTKLDRGGTGLGLAVCQRILLDHGGRIEVASRPGRGTTFTLRLPSAESVS